MMMLIGPMENHLPIPQQLTNVLGIMFLQNWYNNNVNTLYGLIRRMKYEATLWLRLHLFCIYHFATVSKVLSI